MSVCWAAAGLTMLLLRWYLKRQNALREREDEPAVGEYGLHRTQTSVAGERRDEKDGAEVNMEEVYLTDVQGETLGKVDKAFLDMTDIENRDFRYVY
jgi:MFS transporter, ACS family, allantoate permease